MSSSWESTRSCFIVLGFTFIVTQMEKSNHAFFFSSWISMENQTVYNFLLVIIRFHEAYVQLSVAGLPLKHQVKPFSQKFSMQSLWQHING